ncbi:MAG: hypothetical protein AVDCRST_MAG42-1300 [uncultured Chthoniobacterales bacterium]|uniref:Uncharacterized protein n=1 Tax=uncultured Chthoniobacterales bacterium TaxID=1836801 RepID=A0A6J4HVX2_9BACT|nr:MAG: hypothetical protein AVDCRST_MAG42-1300 [uncultured Chthoniobacterales bacterium]
MNTKPESQTFLQPPAVPVAEVKARLQHDYEAAYPQLAEIIHLVIDEEEWNARELSFPHLFLPDLVAAHIEKLNLQPLGTNDSGAPSKRTAFASSATHSRAAEFIHAPESELRAA